MPGDTYRNLRDRAGLLRPDVQAHARTGLAAVLPVRHARATRSSSTADTGRMAGQYPKSPWKIALLVLLALIVLLIVILANQN